MNEEKNQKVLAIVLVIAVIVVGLVKLFFNKKSKEKPIDNNEISIVKDANRFYTVSGCVNTFYTALYSDNVESLLILLSDNYKKENNITKDNIYLYINKMNEYVSFSPKSMYYQQLSENVYKYYVYGALESSYMNFNEEDNYVYISVILDETNTTFSIEPYDGEIFNK